jgi:hypothetical protein
VPITQEIIELAICAAIGIAVGCVGFWLLKDQDHADAFYNTDPLDEMRHLERERLVRQAMQTGDPPLRTVEEILDHADEAERLNPAIRGPFVTRR